MKSFKGLFLGLKLSPTSFFRKQLYNMPYAGSSILKISVSYCLWRWNSGILWPRGNETIGPWGGVQELPRPLWFISGILYVCSFCVKNENKRDTYYNKFIKKLKRNSTFVKLKRLVTAQIRVTLHYSDYKFVFLPKIVVKFKKFWPLFAI